MRLHTRIIPLLALAACDPFGHWPDNYEGYLEGATWDTDVHAAADGIYVRLPISGELLRVTADGGYGLVDLDGASADRIVVTPDGERVMVFASWATCADDDPNVRVEDDCDDDLSFESEVAVITDGARTAVLDLPAHMNSLVFSHDGTTAVAYLDYEDGDDIQIDGVVDLTGVVFVDLESGDARAVPVGFSPSNILFTEDDTRAVIMSRSRAVSVDLDTFEVDVEYPLTLDPDQVVTPSDAILSPDGRYALVAIEDAAELYQLDLEAYAIDIEDLDSPPADLAVNSEMDLTVITYAALERVDIFDHATNELLEPITLDVPVTRALMGEGKAVLFNDRYDTHDVYLLDLESHELTEYVVGNPVESLELTTDGRYAVGVLRPESTYSDGLDSYQDARWGLAVIDLVENDDVSLVFEGEPLGLELVERDGETWALVLMEGLDDLLLIDLANPGIAARLALPTAALGIGSMPDGRFWVTHDAALGQISTFDPADVEINTSLEAIVELNQITGFGSLGLERSQVLPRRAEKEG